MTDREFVEQRMAEARREEIRGWVFAICLCIATAVIGFMCGARWGNL